MIKNIIMILTLLNLPALLFSFRVVSNFNKKDPAYFVQDYLYKHLTKTTKLNVVGKLIPCILITPFFVITDLTLAIWFAHPICCKVGKNISKVYLKLFEKK